MASDFDPYHKWLGIPPSEQPPDHYRLLGLQTYEPDPDVIENAADQRMGHIRTFQSGRFSKLSQRILNELSSARVCLLDPKQKAHYDESLRNKTTSPAEDEFEFLSPAELLMDMDQLGDTKKTWFLHIQDDLNQQVVVELPTRKTILIGRSDECNVRIMGPKVSRQHCQLEFQDRRWTVTDLKSRNGTWVNGQQVSATSIQEGDEIHVGNAYFSLIHRTVDEFGGQVELSPEYKGVSSLSDENIEFNVLNQGLMPVQEPIVEAIDASEDRADRKLLGGCYELIDLIHRGSTGTFYRAMDRKANRAVCVKILSRNVTENEDNVKRFMRGVKTASVLHHRNIVQLHDAGQSDEGVWWLAMEYVDGTSARQLAADVGIGKMLSPERVVSIARDVIAALHVAYEREIIHRGIAPDSILLTKSGVAKLANFTLSRGVVLSTLQQITVSSDTVGDLAYMAPEWIEPGNTGDCRADIYGLGACLYVLLTGKAPFVGRGKVELIDKIRHGQPEPPSKYNMSIAAPLEGLVLKCLEKQPTDRFQSPQELLIELERVAKFRR